MSFLNSLFPGTDRAIMEKGAAIAGGTGPVRMKKGPGLIQSIVGVFLGIVMVLGSPVTMWYAQSQHGAADFQTATSVSADSGASGYITFSGAPEFADENGGEDCYQGECIYQSQEDQMLVTRTGLECGDNVSSTSTKRVISQNGSECDEYGDCVPCYDIEEDVWETQSERSVYYDVQVGGFLVRPSSGAVFFDLEEKTVSTSPSSNSTQTRIVYEYMPLPSTLLVAGDSDGDMVTNGDLVFVLSEHGVDGTITLLEARDQENQIILWIVTFVLIFVGLSLILGPLSWAGRKLRYMPVVGPMLAKGSNFLIGLAALLLAIPLWILLFILISILKSWIPVTLILVVLVVLAVVIVRKRAKKDNT